MLPVRPLKKQQQQQQQQNKEIYLVWLNCCFSLMET